MVLFFLAITLVIIAVGFEILNSFGSPRWASAIIMLLAFSFVLAFSHVRDKNETINALRIAQGNL